MLASFYDGPLLQLYLNPIKLVPANDRFMQSLIDLCLMFDLTYVDGIDQNVVYPPSAPISVRPECIDRLKTSMRHPSCS